MDLEARAELIKGIGKEIITDEDLETLLETKRHPVAYDGFEPSGIAHLPVGIYRPLLLKDLIKAGVRFKLLLADSFAWINNKFDGDLDRIREAGKYFVEVWKAGGVDMKKVEVVWHKDFFDDPEYWKKVILIAKNHSLTRTKRSLTIAGRTGEDSKQAALVFYPSMQCADIFQIGADICQLGMDQRKVNVLAREIASKIKKRKGKEMVKSLGYLEKGVNGKPVIVSHKMLLGLSGPKDASGLDENSSIDVSIRSKMSKSIPESSIFVHDSKKVIKKKINSAYCPAKIVEGNPVMEYSKEIIFRAFDEFEIRRPEKFGGDVSYYSYGDLENDFKKEKLHPMDLKIATAEYLDRLIEPIRTHFETDRKAGELYETIKTYRVTR